MMFFGVLPLPGSPEKGDLSGPGGGAVLLFSLKFSAEGQGRSGVKVRTPPFLFLYRQETDSPFREPSLPPTFMPPLSSSDERVTARNSSPRLRPGCSSSAGRWRPRRLSLFRLTFALSLRIRAIPPPPLGTSSAGLRHKVDLPLQSVEAVEQLGKLSSDFALPALPAYLPAL
ncbi:hypothetical protein THAOC_25137 [Thalassiosira oceanica]|uniref:Uncharacterized protein n=1 Tax=Thalassiosira oceanica TaxID=159749 RepID=K0RQ09_THAOC|nr:hypothetical protein THAOC_25137 [Thalassiosira oceanica]|eukprot:EJK55160.1 hypothetical protein THAOC_25137 [Thalassiosira oceanica]